MHAWDSVVQRPHHWQRQALARGHEVHVYTSPAPYLRSRLMPWRYRDRGVRRLPRTALQFIQDRMLPKAAADERALARYEEFVRKEALARCGQRYDAVIYATFPMRRFERRIGGVVVYDCMDDWGGFGTYPPEVEEWERRIASQSDLLLAVSPPLRDRLAGAHGAGKTVLVPNGCDYGLFASAAPEGAAPRAFGYAGCIHDWFDWAAVAAIAQAHPDALVRLVGPAYCAVPPLPANVRVEGRRPYEAIPAFNASCDVCLIPFRDVERAGLIAAVSPIKLYEYLAAGKPVVSSPMPDVLQLAEPGVVHVADSPEAFAREVGEAARVSADPERIARRRAVAASHSWESRWLLIETRIRELLA